MGLWNKVKGWFSSKDKENEQQEVQENIIDESINSDDDYDINIVGNVVDEPQVFEHTVTHRTKEETAQIKEEIKERPPQEPLPQPEPVRRVPRQRTDRARELMARRQHMREQALKRPNGTEVGPDA